VNKQNEIHYTLDGDGNFTFVNECGERILGYSCAEARGMSLTQVVAPEVRTYLRDQIAQICRQPFGLVYEIDILAKDGTRVTMEVSVSPALRRGEPIEILGFAIPIADRSDFTRSPRCLDADFLVGQALPV